MSELVLLRELYPHRHILREHRLDSPNRLSRPLFVLDERESYVAVAVVAEAYAGGDGYFGFVEQELL